MDRFDALKHFSSERDRLRRQARANHMCTRCVVRRAVRGKAYCQRCTDYAKRYARNRHQAERLDPATGFYRDKIVRIANYGLAGGSGQFRHPPRQRYEHTITTSEADSMGSVSELVDTPQPGRYEHFVDPTLVRASGAAVPLRYPPPIPLGFNAWCDDIEGE